MGFYDATQKKTPDINQEVFCFQEKYLFKIAEGMLSVNHARSA